MHRSHFPLLALVAVSFGCGADAPAAAPPVTVVVTPVVRRDVPRVLQATGTVEPMQTAAVAAQVDGLVERVAFHGGSDVTAGQVLFQLDPAPYRAALAQAAGVLARDRAQYASAQRDQARYEDLAKQEYVTQQQLDQARAATAAMAATVEADSAAVARARLDLSRATVRAPISGRAGTILARQGNLVRASAGQSMVQINQLAPIRVRFALPAADLPAIQQAGLGVPVRALPVGDTGVGELGRLSFVNNQVDSLTGTILVKADFPNAQRRLWPGGMTRVDLTVAVDANALVVPVGAVLTGQQGATVFVVRDSGRAELRHVTVLRSTDSVAVLGGGVEVGDSVVTDGQVRLTDGSRVEILRPTRGDAP